MQKMKGTAKVTAANRHMAGTWTMENRAVSGYVAGLDTRTIRTLARIGGKGQSKASM